MPELVPVAVRDLIALDRSVTQYRLDSLTPRTRVLYKEIWQYFVNFCAPKDAWQATPLDVARWMAHEVVEWEIRPATVRARLVALNCYFEKFGKGYLQGRPGVGTRPSPARDVLVQQTLRGLVRRHGCPRDGICRCCSTACAGSAKGSLGDRLGRCAATSSRCSILHPVATGIAGSSCARTA